MLTFVPFSSSACTLAGCTLPLYSLLVGVKVTLFVAGSIVYSPTLFPSGSKASTGVPGATGLPEASSNTAELALIGTDFFSPSTVVSPGANDTVPSCGCPWIPEDSAGVAVGVTPTICGV